MRIALLIAVCALPALAQTATVPLEFQDLNTALASKLAAFDATIASQWDGSKPPVDFSAELFTANGNRGRQLLTAGAATGAQLELASLQALGVKAVTVAIGFPILYQPFDPADYPGFLSFYRQLAAEIRAAGMKMVVETGVVFPGVFSEGSGLDVADYYLNLANSQYLTGRAQQVVTIAREIQPDYLVIAEEPDTEAELTGKPFIATVTGFSSMVDTFLSQLDSAGFTGTNVGAGVGTWIDGAQGYIQTLAAKSRLNFIDLHVYPIDRTFLNDTITLVDLAQSAGKPVTMCEAWLEKRRDTEFTGVAVADDPAIFARDPFSFWAPVDRQFLTAFTKLAWWKQLKVFSPFWSGYFHAYLNYNSVYDSIAPDQILNDAFVVESTAIENGQYTSTGLAYQSLIAPAAVSAASFTAGPLAPDSMVSIFGAGLAPSTVTGPIPLLTNLAGTTVTFTDSAGATLPAPLYFVSPGQVNAVVPAGLKAGPATFQVSGATGLVTLSPVAPALFSANADGQGAAAALVVRVHLDGSVDPPDYAFQCGTAPGSCVPKPIDVGATGQVFLELFGTGIRGRNALTDVTVSVGGVLVTPQYAGAQPQYPGMDQVNLLLPPALAGRGTLSINLSVAGQHANAVAISVK